MEEIEKLPGTLEIEFDQEKANLNLMENTFADEDGEGENVTD